MQGAGMGKDSGGNTYLSKSECFYVESDEKCVIIKKIIMAVEMRNKPMKKITVLLVCLLCAGGILLAGCGSKAKETLEDYRASGIEELQNGNYAKAVADFEQALSESDKKLSEEETDTMLYLALAQYKNGDYEGAVKSYKAIMSADDNDYRPYYLRGCVYLKQEDVDAAKEDFAMALNLEGDSLELYISIYENLREAGEEAAAGKLMEGALLVKPADADDMARYGYLQYLLQRHTGRRVGDVVEGCWKVPPAGIL